MCKLEQVSADVDVDVDAQEEPLPPIPKSRITEQHQLVRAETTTKRDEAERK